MAVKAKKSLGKGLDALFTNIEAETSSENIKNVDIHLIDTNSEQPRKEFNEEKLNELAESIKRHGIVQPIVVRKNGGRFIIIAGERRFRAARIACLTSVPVIVKDLADDESMEIALIENIQREDLNPVEEAMAIRFLMHRHDLTQQEVAQRLGKSRPAIANSLRLLNLPDAVLALLKQGKIQSGHARALVAIKDDAKMAELAEKIVKNDMSVRETEQAVKAINDGGEAKEAPAKSTKTKSPEILAATRRFREKLNTKVTINGTEDSGKIVIEYYSKEDLQAIYDIISN
ncbi:MAG: ParB/RepB/Spo0J family partition protein [Clostridia bacterium]|nr:ParB/RepB/Spo0J family partition protein [Clostridia bacterium]